MKGHEKKHERAIAEESSIIFVHLLSCFMGIQNIHNSKSAFWCRELEMGATRLGDGALLSWAQFGLLFFTSFCIFLHLLWPDPGRWHPHGRLCASTAGAVQCWEGWTPWSAWSPWSRSKWWAIQWPIWWSIWWHRRMISLWSPACCQSGQPEDLTVKFHPGVTVNRDVRWL